MAQRKSISKKLRFEVFKRDNFTCQYCGRSAPDVILEVDHINPVAKGGETEILNLITACKDCNRGKGAKELTENEILTKQKEQLKELNARREQLKMMLDWKSELENFENEQFDKFDDAFGEKTGFGISEHGERSVKKWIKQFGLIEVLECLDISVEQYFDDEDPKVTIEKTLNYIPRICSVRKKQKENPFIYKQNYIRAILKNRSIYVNDAQFRNMMSGFDENDFEALKDIAINCRNWTDFKDTIYETFWGDEDGD